MVLHYSSPNKDKENCKIYQSQHLLSSFMVYTARINLKYIFCDMEGIEDLEIQMVFTSLLTIDTHDFKSKYINIGSEMLSRKIVLDLIFCIQNQNDELLLYRGNWAHQMCLPALSSKFSYPLCQYISLTFLQDLPSTCELEHILSKVL